MGYHADTSPGMENNELSPQAKLQDVIGAKYFTTTGRDFPYCRKYIFLLNILLLLLYLLPLWLQIYLPFY